MKTNRAHAGLTLLELAIALVVLAILAALAVPSFSARMARERLASAAEKLAADMAEARFDAARSGQPMYVLAQAGGDACWAISTSPTCDCTQALPCQIRRVPGTAHKGIRIVQAQAVRLEPGGTAIADIAATFESSAGDRLRVEVLALGRTRICAAAGPTNKYPAC